MENPYCSCELTPRAWVQRGLADILGGDLTEAVRHCFLPLHCVFPLLSAAFPLPFALCFRCFRLVCFRFRLPCVSAAFVPETVPFLAALHGQ